MKSLSFTTAAVVATALFSAAAGAQTGRPSSVEVHAAADAPQAVVVDTQLGSYARYLMLNGATRDEAVAAARNVDNAPTRTLLASRSASRKNAPARVQE